MGWNLTTRNEKTVLGGTSHLRDRRALFIISAAAGLLRPTIVSRHGELISIIARGMSRFISASVILPVEWRDETGRLFGYVVGDR